MSEEACVWCAACVGPDEGFRACEPAGRHRAVFCRLEHVVPWAIKGAAWDSAVGSQGDQLPLPSTCAHCGLELGDRRVVLVHHRGEHRISDGFCGVEHMRKWAGSGGHWRSRPAEPA